MAKKFILPVVMLLIVASALVGFAWWQSAIKPVSTVTTPKSLVIAKGSGAIKIAQKLQEEGFIKSPLAFRIYVKLTGKEAKIQAGEYELSPNLGLYSLVNELVKGPNEVWVTIPEGLRREEVVERYISAFGLTGTKAQEFREEFLSLAQDKEGYLFPDTYLLAKNTPASKVVNLMTNTFSKKTAGLGSLATNGLSELEVITVASMLERETVTEDEKPLVAGIILKRLDNDWPLQIDATVQYVVGDSKNWWPILTKDDIEVRSAYNTYKNTGLPPSPIASPGLSSIEAVLKAQESEYWFYIHDTKGQVHFSKTLEEHNANIRKYLGK